LKRSFIRKAFSASSQATIERANEIIAEYGEEGYTLTLRQLYYQFVARAWIENTTRSYKRLGAIINDGRLAGLIDWSAIEDRGRSLRSVATWESPTDIVRSAAHSFKLDLWQTQERVVEVWIEKEALVSIAHAGARKRRAPVFACKGYVSQSAMYDAARRMERYHRGGQEALLIYLGDHDPSGLDMTRDIRERLNLLLGTPVKLSFEVEVVRIALTRAQVDEYDPPPNPAKMSDARFAKYKDEHGDESWELDALQPSVLVEMIERTIDAEIDERTWSGAILEENGLRTGLEAIADDYGVVSAFALGRKDGAE
jgi:hypothetical protein